jgi:hypothetical protein
MMVGAQPAGAARDDPVLRLADRQLRARRSPGVVGGGEHAHATRALGQQLVRLAEHVAPLHPDALPAQRHGVGTHEARFGMGEHRPEGAEEDHREDDRHGPQRARGARP